MLPLDALNQLLRCVEIALMARQIECGLGLFFGGGFDVPAQNLSAKCRQGRLVGALLSRHQQDCPDVGARKVLDQACQQLDFGLGQCLSIVHDPDLGLVHLRGRFDGLVERLAGQHFVEAPQQRVGVGGKVDLDPVIRGLLVQAGQQQTQVMVEQGFKRTIQGQAQALMGHGIGAAIDAHAIGGPKDVIFQGGAVGVDLDVHARAGAFSSRLPSGLNSMLGGTLTLGLACGGFTGEAASRLKT